MSPAFYPIFLLMAPGVLITFSALGLFQFSQMFKAFVIAVQHAHGNALWTTFQPPLKQLAGIMELMLGPATKFSPNTSHVLLVSIALAVIVGSERIRSAIKEAKR